MIRTLSVPVSCYMQCILISYWVIWRVNLWPTKNPLILYNTSQMHHSLSQYKISYKFSKCAHTNPLFPVLFTDRKLSSHPQIDHTDQLWIYTTETEMLWFWRNFCHWLHRKFSANCGPPSSNIHLWTFMWRPRNIYGTRWWLSLYL